MTDRLTIVMACDEGYAMPLATALRSLADSNPRHWPIDVHIISDGFSEHGKERVERSLPAGAASLQWLVTSTENFAALGTLSHVSLMTFARLQLADVLPEHLSKVLYLDADLLVLGDVGPLWATDLEGHCAGAVRDTGIDPLLKRNDPETADLPTVRDYFNAGVLLIDLPAWRRQKTGERAIKFLEANPRTRFSDQDALNVVLDGQWRELPECWNFQGHRNIRIDRMTSQPCIAHFVTKLKPWLHQFHTPNETLFDRYRSRTRYARGPAARAADAGRTGLFWLKRFVRLFVPRTAP